MTLQEVFDTAVGGVVGQGGPSWDGVRNCLYRGPNGRKCAAGWLISDDQVIEGNSIREIEHGWPEQVVELVQGLQCAHDSATIAGTEEQFLKVFLEEANSLAREHGLKKWSNDTTRAV